MSELKAGVINTPHNEGMSFNRDSDHVSVTECETEFYLKSEADEVIAELKNQVYEYAQGLYEIQSRAENEIRHGKYKRCLAMAEACKHKRWRADVCDEQGFDYARSTKHMNKWLELADKLKESKCR